MCDWVVTFELQSCSQNCVGWTRMDVSLIVYDNFTFWLVTLLINLLIPYKGLEIVTFAWLGKYVLITYLKEIFLLLLLLITNRKYFLYGQNLVEMNCFGF